MNSIVITGATGMLGLALTRLCIEKNIRVLAIVRPHSLGINSIPKNNLVEIKECALSDLNQMSNIISDKYEAFFHFAWDGTFGESRNDMYLQNDNVKYTLDALNLAEQLGCKMFVGAGSQAEYGRVSDVISPQTPANPENGYGIAKLCAGQMIRVMSEPKNIKSIWCRIFSVYGQHNGKDTMIMSSISKLIAGQVPSYTKSEQMWDYLHCDDAARAFLLMAEKGKDKAVYCLGSGQAFPLSEYIIKLRDSIDPKLKLGFGDIEYSPKQVMHLCADITDLTKDTGFVPEISFDEGIRKTIDWYRQEYKN